MRTLLIAMAGLVVAGAGASSADVTCVDTGSFGQDCVINNGLAPPNPDNVIDDATYMDDTLFVRNVDCPPGWPASGRAWDDCPSPDAPTEVEVVPGAQVPDIFVLDSSTLTIRGGFVAGIPAAVNSATIVMSGGEVDNWLEVYESSTVIMSGGRVWYTLSAHHSSTVTMTGGRADWLDANDDSTVTMRGGQVGLNLNAREYSTVTMNGGTVGLGLWARDFSTIRIVGTDFEVDGAPVFYGDLEAQTGTLTGTLTMGDPIDNEFYQGGWTASPCTVTDPCTGTITLVQAPQLPTLSPWSQLALMAGLLGAGLGVWRWRAPSG